VPSAQPAADPPRLDFLGVADESAAAKLILTRVLAPHAPLTFFFQFTATSYTAPVSLRSWFPGCRDGIIGGNYFNVTDFQPVDAQGNPVSAEAAYLELMQNNFHGVPRADFDAMEAKVLQGVNLDALRAALVPYTALAPSPDHARSMAGALERVAHIERVLAERAADEATCAIMGVSTHTLPDMGPVPVYTFAAKDNGRWSLQRPRPFFHLTDGEKALATANNYWQGVSGPVVADPLEAGYDYERLHAEAARIQATVRAVPPHLACAASAAAKFRAWVDAKQGAAAAAAEAAAAMGGMGKRAAGATGGTGKAAAGAGRQRSGGAAGAAAAAAAAVEDEDESGEEGDEEEGAEGEGEEEDEEMEEETARGAGAQRSGGRGGGRGRGRSGGRGGGRGGGRVGARSAGPTLRCLSRLNNGTKCGGTLTTMDLWCTCPGGDECRNRVRPHAGVCNQGFHFQCLGKYKPDKAANKLTKAERDAYLCPLCEDRVDDETVAIMLRKKKGGKK
jgi:hypothetical protein